MLVLKPVENEVEQFDFDPAMLPPFAVYRLLICSPAGALALELSMS
jgi:hypothetical protein